MSPKRSLRAPTFGTRIADFEYKPILPVEIVADPIEFRSEQTEEPTVCMTEQEFQQRLSSERVLGAAEAETRLRSAFQEKSEIEARRVSMALSAFDRSRQEYFTRVEAEVVQLALAIAGKIIHREAQVDPMLVTALVQIALHQLKDSSAASIRVRPEEIQLWRERLLVLKSKVPITITEDKDLQPGDCILETELGKVNLSLQEQLKEVERGFLDVLAQKPKL